jgi:ribosome recycling factor
MENEMVVEIMNEMVSSFDRIIDSLKKELSRTRTGRANLALLDGVRIDYYGSPTPLNQVATLSIADPRLIIVKPWDKTTLAPIEKAIIQAEIGITPVNDGEVIRLPIPPLTGERRKELVKMIKRYGENAKVSIRNIRRDSNALLDDVKDLPEDDLHRSKKKVQDETDEFIKKVDAMVDVKEKEITEF